MSRLYYILIVVIGYCSFNSCVEKTDKIVFHKTHESKKEQAPFSDIVGVGDLYFLSGQIGLDHKTRQLVDGGIEAETKQTLENIKAVLSHHQLDMNQVVKCTVILKNIEDFNTMNEIYKQYFPQKPARTTFAVGNLALGARIEIECVVAKM